MSTQLRNGTVTEDPRLDRLVEFDEKSRDYPIRALLGPERYARLRSYTWACPVWLDQGQEGACVEFGIAHELGARPVVIPEQKLIEITTNHSIYWEAQRQDPWQGGSYPGANPRYEGTSTLTGLKVAKDMGFYSEYRWAFGLEDVVTALAYKGPVVIGVNWYQGMFDTDSKGFIHVDGSLNGGHCTLLRGVKLLFNGTGRSFYDIDLDRSFARGRNSWGKGWGVEGDFLISLRDLNRLLREDGEAAVGVRRLKGREAA